MDRWKRRVVWGGAAATVVAVGTLVTLGIGAQRAASLVEEQAAALVDADVAIGAVDLSLLSWDFPLVSLSVDDLRVTGRAPFEGVVLAEIDSMRVGLDLFSLLSGSEIEIHTVRIEGGRFDVVVDEAGRTNYEIYAAGDDAEADAPADWRVRLEQVTAQDLSVRYRDRSSALDTRIEGMAVDASGDWTADRVRLASTGTIDAMTVDYGGVNWLRATRWSSEMVVDYDQGTGTMTFGENRMLVNALPLSFSGSVTPQDDGYLMDLGFETTASDFAPLLSLVPEAYSPSFEGVEASGTVSLKGTAKGRYLSEGDDLPALDIALKVANAGFKYPDLPTRVERIDADIHVTHPQGPADAVVVDVRQFALAIPGSGIEGRARLATPMSDPDVVLKMRGKMDLERLRSAIPVAADGAPMTGQLDVDLDIAGKMSDFERQRLGRVRADGHLRAQELRLDDPEWTPVPLRIRDLSLALSPQRAELHTLVMAWQGSDLSVSGTVDNLLSWVLVDADLQGRLDLASNRLNLRPFQVDPGDDPTAPDPEDDTVLIAVPDHLDLVLDAQIGTLKTDELDLEQVEGRMTVKDNTVRMERLNAEMLGGRVVLGGAYKAKTAERAELDLQVETFAFSLDGAMETFETLRKYAPIFRGAGGSFDSGFRLETGLARDGTPEVSVLSSAGSLKPIGVRLQPAVLASVASQLGDKSLGKLVMTEVKVSYNLEKGRASLRPFEARLGQVPATFSGSIGVLDRSMDLTIAMSVPTAMVKNAAALTGLQGVLPEAADVIVQVTGTYERPRVEVKLANAVGDALVEEVGEIVDDGLAQAQARADALIAEARVAADALVAEAAKAAAKLRKQAKKEARKLVEAASGNPLQKVAAEQAAALVEKEADKAAKKLEREASNKADQLIGVAEKEANTLIETARSEAKNALR